MNWLSKYWKTLVIILIIIVVAFIIFFAIRKASGQSGGNKRLETYEAVRDYKREYSSVGPRNLLPTDVGRIKRSCKKLAIAASPFPRASKMHRVFVRDNEAKCVAQETASPNVNSQ
jgi:hypothetical protein